MPNSFKSITVSKDDDDFTEIGSPVKCLNDWFNNTLKGNMMKCKKFSTIVSGKKKKSSTTLRQARIYKHECRARCCYFTIFLLIFFTWQRVSFHFFDPKQLLRASFEVLFHPSLTLYQKLRKCGTNTKYICFSSLTTSIWEMASLKITLS